MKRMLMVLAAALAGLGLMYFAGILCLGHALTQADPFPAFMADYQLRRSQSYGDAERNFSDFVAKTFAIGSDKNDAIAQISKGGFQVATSASETVEFVWKRHSGPCSEQYSIVIRSDGRGKIAKVAGQLRPICL